MTTTRVSEDRSKTGGTHQPPGGPLNVATFDGVRGLVVLFIVLVHCTITSGWLPHAEFPLALRMSSIATLEFLFAISGFVLFLPVAARGSLGSVRSYAIRRVGRIVPGYS
jgi:peptidoglycan/LPS O-acetylase OafA/YrhL